MPGLVSSSEKGGRSKGQKKRVQKEDFRKGMRGGKRGMKLFLNQVEERGWKGGRREIEKHNRDRDRRRDGRSDRQTNTPACHNVSDFASLAFGSLWPPSFKPIKGRTRSPRRGKTLF